MVDEFIKAVREYCTLIENNAEIPNNEFVYGCLTSLSSLYNLAIQLPDFESATDDLFEVELKSRMGELIKKFNGKDFYGNVPDPYGNCEKYGNIEASYGSLSDDLSDIYNDIKSSLIQYDTEGDNNKIDALWQWKFDFTTHYGIHIVNALTALHRLHIDYSLDDNETDEFSQ
jgi:hypothetical protein